MLQVSNESGSPNGRRRPERHAQRAAQRAVNPQTVVNGYVMLPAMVAARCSSLFGPTVPQRRKPQCLMLFRS